MAKKTKHDEPDEIETLPEPDPAAEPETQAPTPADAVPELARAVRVPGHQVADQQRHERRVARLKEKGY